MQQKTPREETAHVGLRKANVHLEIPAHSRLNQIGKNVKGKGRDRLG